MDTRSQEKAFTLIELLVVIAIIALLLSVVLPGLNMAKKKAASAACLSNVRQMAMGWYMYAEDNDSKIMSALMENCGVEKPCRHSWIGVPHAATDLTVTTLPYTSGSVTDEDEIRGIMQGQLYPYLEAPGVYHCPADKLRKRTDGTRMYNSYSIPRCLRAYTDPGSSYYNIQINKMTDITSPGNRFVFVENGETDRGNWIQAGQFNMATPEYGDVAYGLWSPVAISHGNSAVFGFTDGHAEVRKWHDSIVFEHYRKTEGLPPGTQYGKTIPKPGSSDDMDFISRGWAYRYRK